MPLYEYRCRACQQTFEAYTRLSDERKSAACPACGGESEKVGISLIGATGTGERGETGRPACGAGSRRSPFS